MIDLTILSPADSAPPESFRDNLFLWQAEVKPLPDAPDPGPADIQEIVVEPGTDDEYRLVFNLKDPDLTDRIRAVCNSCYVEGGLDAVKTLRAAMVDTGYSVGAAFPTWPPRKPPPAVQGEQFYQNPTDTPKRNTLSNVVEDWQDDIQEFITKVIGRVQTVALQVASTRLQASADQTLRQALRYLRSGAPGGTQAPANTLVAAGAPLTGPDAGDLAAAIAQIAALRRELAKFSSQVQDAQKQLKGVGLTDQPLNALGPALLRAASSKDLQALLESPSGVEALGRATQGQEAAQRLLAQECSALCRSHLVLYKLWDQQVVLDVGDLWSRAPASQQLAVIQSDGALAQALSQALNGAAAAANEFIDDLRQNPDEIWRYDNAIYAALDGLHLHQGDLAWRAAQDHLQSFKGDLSPMGTASVALGGIEILAAEAAVAPPVAVVVAILSAGAGVASLIEDAVNQARLDRAFQACLDPADSLALEPGSYTGIVIGALFMLIQLRGVGKTLGKWPGSLP